MTSLQQWLNMTMEEVDGSPQGIADFIESRGLRGTPRSGVVCGLAVVVLKMLAETRSVAPASRWRPWQRRPRVQVGVTTITVRYGGEVARRELSASQRAFTEGFDRWKFPNIAVPATRRSSLYGALAVGCVRLCPPAPPQRTSSSAPPVSLVAESGLEPVSPSFREEIHYKSLGAL